MTALAVAIGAASCSGTTTVVADDGTTIETTGFSEAGSDVTEGPPPPSVPDGPVDAEVTTVLAEVVPSLRNGALDPRIADALGASGDARLAWIVSDLMRFSGPDDQKGLADAFTSLTGFDLREAAGDGGPWRVATDQLITWDTPAAPGYREFKIGLLVALEPRWEALFADADLDWRVLNWGGVLIDDRPLGSTERCLRGCIPALDDPPLTAASAGSWYPDDQLVFAITVGGESVALPKHQMEVHEMVNLSIGGRRLAVPYCTLCGTAEAYLTDRVDGATRPLVMRTSGLLSLSNKVMFDLDSRSAFDTFTGRAVSGPLRLAGVQLPRVTVVTAPWGEWRAAHPGTKLLARDAGLGRDYDLDPLAGRDDRGPIFPVRRDDTRLEVHTQVLGVIAPDGTAVAFPADEARATLRAGEVVSMAGVSVVEDGGGLRANAGSAELPARQSFWFAWAQFHPGSRLWARSP
jgi:hypothetical protein